MGIFNEIGSSSDVSVTTTGERGRAGPAGVGYKLDSDNNFDLENKKLTNLKSGTDPNDVIKLN